ncbi:hypothetical protein MKX01_009651, partial [Papaver californicum]
EVLVLDPDLSKDYLDRMQNRTKEKKYMFDYAFGPNSKNIVIYDLLEKSSGHLELREDPEQGIVVAGLRSIKVHSADRILELLNLGSSRRKTESTEANATSSRSHAVLEITIRRKHKNQYQNQVIRGKLALVDLAGSETASETNSGGQKLRDGANINRSLLALANCINALGKQHKKGLAYVPYRNSKLTRILKDSLSGNSQTVMIATVSPANSQYHHTVNTLKYADRAKEIKTHIQKNIGTVDTHVSDYQRMIDNLQIEVCRLRKELADKETQLSVKPAERTVDDEPSWLNALFELEETNLRNRIKLQHLDDSIAKERVIRKDGAVVQALRLRRQNILDNIRDNDDTGANYQKEIVANENHRRQLQDMIEEAISNNGNRTYLHILSQYRLLGMANTELQFEMAMRDQVINNQREAQRNLWNLIMGLGIDQKKIMETASKQGITIEDWAPASPAPSYGRLPPLWTGIGQSYSSSSPVLQHQQDVGCRSWGTCESDAARTVHREEHHSSYVLLSHDHSPSAYLGISSSTEQWVSSGRSNPRHCTPEMPSYQKRRVHSSPIEGCVPNLSLPPEFVPNEGTCNTNRWQPAEHPQIRQNTGHSPCKEIMTRHTGSARPLFLNSLTELSGTPSSPHVLHGIAPPNRQPVSHLLPSYTAVRPVPFITATSPELRSHRSSIV